jgi:hypothetical protein
MPCGACVEKLALKLMGHHKIDMIRAYELAEKGVERFEARNPQPPPQPVGHMTDYTQPCLLGTCDYVSFSCTKEAYPCTISTDCVGGACAYTGTCACPTPSKANSHYVGNTCLCSGAGTCVKCVSFECSPQCSSKCYGLCSYDCDTGYVWNPATQQCELPAVTKEILGDGIVFAST